MRFLFVMDPPETMIPDRDTSFAFMRGSLARGHECWHCQPHEVGYRERTVAAWARRIVVHDTSPHFELLDQQRLETRNVDAIFVRKDPPFDSAYLHLTQLLDLAERSCFVWNAPRGLRTANEKLFALLFAEFMPKTRVSCHAGDLVEFVEQVGGQAVMKPLDGAGGFGIVRLARGDKNNNALIELLTESGRRPALVQEYLPKVTSGDKRALLLDGKLLGAIRRVPRPDDIRANIHVGGRVEPTELSAGERAIVEQLTPRLLENGLFFVGLDFIDGRLIEINVTSPTGLQQLSRHCGRALEQEVIVWVEQRVNALRGQS